MTLHRTACVGICLVLLWTNAVHAAASAAGAVSAQRTDEISARIDGNFETFSRVGSLLDRSQISIKAVLETHDYDADSLVEFVRDEIAFQAYAGVLRGAEGTLISRAGNAIDQSLLLAKLLKQAGHDARIARARLTREQALTLVRAQGKPRNWPS